jgi:hypothetical protein
MSALTQLETVLRCKCKRKRKRQFTEQMVRGPVRSSAASHRCARVVNEAGAWASSSNRLANGAVVRIALGSRLGCSSEFGSPPSAAAEESESSGSSSELRHSHSPSPAPVGKCLRAALGSCCFGALRNPGGPAATNGCDSQASAPKTVQTRRQVRGKAEPAGTAGVAEAARQAWQEWQERQGRHAVVTMRGVRRGAGRGRWMV